VSISDLIEWLVMAISNIWKIVSCGKLLTIGVKAYENKEGTIELKELKWGVMELGQMREMEIFVMNTSNVDVVLELSDANWNPPSAEQSIVYAWDYVGTVLVPMQLIAVMLQCSIEKDVHDIIAWSNDLIIIGVR